MYYNSDIAVPGKMFEAFTFIINPKKQGIGEKSPTLFKTILHHDALS